MLLALTMCVNAQAQSTLNEPSGGTAPPVVDPIRPTRIDPVIVTYGFDQKPVVREHVGHGEPFLEGVLTYGYGGRVETPVMQGRDTVIPAASPAFGVPMVLGATRNVELVWCAIIETPRPNLQNRCMAGGQITGGGGIFSLMPTSYFVSKSGNEFTGGKIVSDRFDLGAPIRVSYYIQNLGKITRIKAQIRVGDVLVNQWGIIWGTILRPKSADEKLVNVAGGLIGVRPDPDAKGHYIVREIAALHAGASAVLVEVRDDPEK